MVNKITLLEVKEALKDKRFRDSLPESFKPEIQKYLSNPSCACNVPIYKLIINNCQKELSDYFPGKEIDKKPVPSKNDSWVVINCHKNDLESRLNKLPVGNKQVAITRYEDQITCIVNFL